MLGVLSFSYTIAKIHNWIRTGKLEFLGRNKQKREQTSKYWQVYSRLN
jgi:hypothetical protein